MMGSRATLCVPIPSTPRTKKLQHPQTALAVTLASGYRYTSPVPVLNFLLRCIAFVYLVSHFPHFLLTVSPHPIARLSKIVLPVPPYDAERAGAVENTAAPFMLQAEGVYPPAHRVRDVAFPKPSHHPHRPKTQPALIPPGHHHTNNPLTHFPVSSPSVSPRTSTPHLIPTLQPSLLPPPKPSRFAHPNPFQPLSNDVFPPDPSHPSDFVSPFCLTHSRPSPYPSSLSPFLAALFCKWEAPRT
jgi:hypothetical protein